MVCSAPCLDLIFASTPSCDLGSCYQVSKLWNDRVKKYQNSPKLVAPGVFEAVVIKNNEKIFLRMELITKENASDWFRYKYLTQWLAQDRSRGVFTRYLLAAPEEYPTYEKAQEYSGFSLDEYNAFKEKMIEAGKNKKIINTIQNLAGGSQHMSCGFSPGRLDFIVYATKNANFSIANTAKTEQKIKNYIETYGDILISVGSDFSYAQEYLHNRGIFRNPYWIIEDKYGGFSMLLHAMTGAVAEKFFQEKVGMLVQPLGGMQILINKSLQFGDGYVVVNGKRIDITELDDSLNYSENWNCIYIPALSRIFYNET